MKRGKAILPALCGIFILQEAACAKFDGFYVGASLGHLHQNTSIDAKQDPADAHAHINNTQSQRGLPTVEFFLGWGKVLRGCFYGGVEGQIDLVRGGAKKIAEDTGFIFMSGRKGPGVAMLMRLGYLVASQTMIYGGVGGEGSEF